jgi:FKBP-type peptidyl-prolyl cis-trans isomerase FklB
MPVQAWHTDSRNWKNGRRCFAGGHFNDRSSMIACLGPSPGNDDPRQEKSMRTTYLKQSVTLAVAACVSATVWAAGNEMELKSETDKASYALGYQIGSDFKHQKMDLNEAAVVRGIADARTGAAALMSEESMHGTLVELKRKVVEQERAAMPEVVKSSARVTAAAETQEGAAANATKLLRHARRAAAKTTEGAREFLEKNAQAKGVVTLSSGLQYRVLKQGSGRQPQEADRVALIYRGAFINGNEFGNTDKDGKPTPRTYPLTALVPGMREAVSHMKEGDKWQVFVPPQLGFDASTPLYRKVTVFDVELVAVNP